MRIRASLYVAGPYPQGKQPVFPMSQTLPDRIRKAPGMSAGLVFGLLVGLITGNWILWIVIGGIVGLAYDRRRGRR